MYCAGAAHPAHPPSSFPVAAGCRLWHSAPLLRRQHGPWPLDFESGVACVPAQLHGLPLVPGKVCQPFLLICVPHLHLCQLILGRCANPSCSCVLHVHLCQLILCTCFSKTTWLALHGLFLVPRKVCQPFLLMCVACASVCQLILCTWFSKTT